MIAQKKKISKREIQEDNLVTTFYQVQDFYDKNKQTIIIAVVAIAIIAFASAWYTNRQIEDNLLATEAMAKVIPSYENGSFQEAIDGQPGTQLSGLKNIVDNYGGTEQGELAKIYLANSYYNLGDYANAQQWYSSFSGNSKIHKAAAYAGQAVCSENEKNYDKAADYFSKAASVSKYNAQTPDYLLNSGINFLKAQNSDKAKSIFERIKKDFGESAVAKEVDKYLAQI
ncbi:MAG: tetratricopeptide repeat protein [Ignavibacteriae bacterium]|nr:tetratricopeptide repeat protein [Ignavibacteriota bacterium]